MYIMQCCLRSASGGPAHAARCVDTGQVDDAHAQLLAVVDVLQRPDVFLGPPVPLDHADDLGSNAYHSIYMGKHHLDRQLREGLARVYAACNDVWADSVVPGGGACVWGVATSCPRARGGMWHVTFVCGVCVVCVSMWPLMYR
jgi:hypothetical protein